MNAQLKPAPVPQVAPSQVTCSLVDQLIQRDAFGQRKYGVSMDRKDLTIRQWLQHGVEELLDGAGYLTSAMREIQSLEEELVKAREQLSNAQVAAREYALFRKAISDALQCASNLTGGRDLRACRETTAEQGYDRGQDDAIECLAHAIDAYDVNALLRQLRSQK